MRRRDLLGLIGIACLSSVTPTIAQQRRSKRIGVLMGYNENDREAQERVQAFKQRLRQLGWREGENLAFESRWVAGSTERMDTAADELVRAQPDLILGATTGVLRALLRRTKTIPIVFISVSNPVGDGFVVSMHSPGGNATGFTNLERPLGGKWVDILRELAPSLTQVAALFNPSTSADQGAYYGRPFEAAALSLGLQAVQSPARNKEDIDAIVAKLAGRPPGGLVVMPDVFTVVNREAIIGAAAKHGVPAIYPYRYFVGDGGLVAYGIDLFDQYRRAADYVQRIFSGESTAALPVQGPAKFELAINLKTAKALGLTPPPALLSRADEVIE